MKTYFKLELKKTLFSRKTVFSILIITGLLLAAYLQDVMYFNPYLENIINPFPGIDGIDYYIRIAHFSLIGFIGPIVAGLIYSTSIISDKESGFLNNLLEVISVKTYYLVKVAVNALTTFIVFIFSHGIIILYLILSFGINNITTKDLGVPDLIIFANVYEFSKIVYIILILIITATSAAAFSTFILGIASVFNSKLVAYIFPGFFMVVTGIFFEVWLFNSVIDFNVAELFNLIAYPNTNVGKVIAYDLILILIGIMTLYNFGYKGIANLSKEA